MIKILADCIAKIPPYYRLYIKKKSLFVRFDYDILYDIFKINN